MCFSVCAFFIGKEQPSATTIIFFIVTHCLENICKHLECHVDEKALIYNKNIKNKMFFIYLCFNSQLLGKKHISPGLQIGTIMSIYKPILPNHDEQ